MHSKDYIPHVEALFVLWIENFILILTAKAAAWGILPAEMAKLAELLEKFKEKYAIAVAPATCTNAAKKAKNDAKKELVTYVRKIYRTRLLFNDSVTNEDHELLQIPIHDTTHTPSPSPHSAPIGRIDTSVHLQHKIKVTDTVEISKRSSIPDKVRGYEIWRKIDGNIPTTESEFSYLATSTSSLHIETYKLDIVGKIVWYRFRWVNSRNQPGPWSEIISAIIP